MPTFRVCNPDGKVLDKTELPDSTGAYDWFKTVQIPDDTLEYRLEVNHEGAWRMIDSADGGTNPHASADRRSDSSG